MRGRLRRVGGTDRCLARYTEGCKRFAGGERVENEETNNYSGEDDNVAVVVVKLQAVMKTRARSGCLKEETRLESRQWIGEESQPKSNY